MKLFDSVKSMAPRRNKFDLSHDRKMSFNMGDIVPVLVQEILPGDSFRVRTETMLRVAPMLAPIMHRVDVKMEYFFVPNRLIWNEWEDFITGGRLGTSAPTPPFINTFNILDEEEGYAQKGTLWDYMGLPTLDDAMHTAPDFESVPISALPFRAYLQIYNEYYRDQNLTEEVPMSLASGGIGDAAEIGRLMTMRKRAWEKDYFTSSLPFAQRGSTVGVPITTDPSENTVLRRVSTGQPFSQAGDLTIGSTGLALMTGSASEDGGVNVGAEGHEINVTDLRRSIRLQEWLELAARVGARYTELLKGFFGIISSDARLQRPEWLGGSRTPMSISEVLSTVQQVDPSSGDPVGTPQGDMSGRGISVGNQNGFKRSFEEHGWVIGVVSVLPRTAYQQGIPKHWSRFDKFDYYWKQFANIGEQGVLYREVYYDGDNAGTSGKYYQTFGYQSRYAEYKQNQGTVHGDFRDSLSFWHMGRIFTAIPELNTNFIESDPTHRIFAVEDPTVHKLWCHMYHRMDALRPMPYYGTPTL